MGEHRRIMRGLLAACVAVAAALATAPVTTGVAQAQPLEDREIVAVTGLDDQLWVSDSGGARWRPLGGRLISGPVVVRGAAEVYFVGIGTDRNVWIRTPDVGWRPYGPDGTVCQGEPGASATGDSFAVACVGADSAVWIATTLLPLEPDVVPTARGPESVGWGSLGGVVRFGAAVSVYQPDQQQQPVFAISAVGADDRPWVHSPDLGWRQFSSEPCAGPLAASLRFEVLACRAPDGQLKAFHTRFGPAARLLGGRIEGRPAIAVFGSGQVDHFVLGTDRGVWLTRERATRGQDPYARLDALGRFGLSAVAPR